MQPGAVGRLHDDIVRFGYVLRVADERLVDVSDIAGEDDFSFFSLFLDKYLDTR